MDFLQQAMSAVPIGQSSLAHILINILVGFVMGLVIAWTYRVTHVGFTYARTFMFTLVFLTTIATLVIIAIGESVARAFALAGALSIIRFRTPIKDTRDMTFVFFALISGLAMGTGHLAMAVLATLLIAGLILLYYRLSGTYFVEAQKYMLRLTTDDVAGTERFVGDALKDLVRDQRLMNVSKPQDDGVVEMVYVVRLLDDATVSRVSEKLAGNGGIRNVSTLALSDTVDF